MDYNGYLNYSLDNVCLLILDLLKDQLIRFPYRVGGPC